jgi:cytoskeletal protein CcmA (bactofilin family)
MCVASFHNTIVSEKSLIVRTTGKIIGKIHYAEIEIEKGGEIEGALSQGAEPPSSSQPNTQPHLQALSLCIGFC